MKQSNKVQGLMLIALIYMMVFSSCNTNDNIYMTGESLVLADTIPGKLCFDALIKDSVVVRNTYQATHPLCEIYKEGLDYTVDYEKGEIKRTINSNIPDYSQHPLYGHKDFDHTKFPDYSNHTYFIWVDYVCTKGEILAKPNDQSQYLVSFIEKLESGEPLSIVSYGNSITAGGEATSTELRFQYRWVDYLKRTYPKANITLEDVSIPGRCSNHGIEKWDDYIGKTSPDLVLLGWGMNDHNKGGNTPPQYKSYLVQLVGMIKEKKNAEVIIFSAFPPNDEWSFGSHSMALYAEAAKQAALEAGCTYVDVHSVWSMVLERKDQSSLLNNNINHPNDFGHWLYLQAFEAVSF
jgi:acyl-CoA thioesterase I